MSGTKSFYMVVTPGGTLTHIQRDEATRISLRLGTPQITRASHVEPDAEGNWFADMSPISGPVLGPYAPDRRDDCLAAESDWILRNHFHIPESTLKDLNNSESTLKETPDAFKIAVS